MEHNVYISLLRSLAMRQKTASFDFLDISPRRN